MEGKGKLVGWGTTGVVQLTSTGVVIKTPWKGEDLAQCRKDMLTEARVYQRLGRHPRLVGLLDWGPEHYTLTLEYMPNGSLRDYLKADPNGISAVQRLIWAKETAEGVQLLHSANVIYCNVGPRNFLVGGDLGLRIADFSGSSFDGSRAVEDDIFSLGSTIYTLIIGQDPFRELDSDEVETRYAARTFPDVTDQSCGDIIQGCWAGGISSAQEVVDILAAKLLTAKEKEQSARCVETGSGSS
ncbi:Serine threonine protein kinase [Colletotrichum higginsianum IMI 349063]|uniref:Serine threonine protein kinase n=1 Tax=Colletotrichum higginsianum (strain IMI 349063) TaxID=759273 RepID=A0A1B7YUH2_COLHI|nr:Serine threonine protein kinase [Colletotrichum higginsianum IMI 349063]OBR15687.1 Serine threonine protein kinase [Colletotrichum higginsianum IMI 349063]